MKRLLTAILSFVLFASCACAETMVCIIPKGQYVNVREKASLKAFSIGEVRNGDEIECDGYESGWVKCTFKGETAYVKAVYFEFADDADYRVTGNGRVRLRDSAGGKKVDFIALDTVVHVYGWQYAKDGSLWARTDGGFISKAFLEIVVTEDEQ